MTHLADATDFANNVILYADINAYLLKKCETINPDNMCKFKSNNHTLQEFCVVSKYIEDDTPSESFLKNVLTPYCIIRDELEQFLHDISEDSITSKHIKGLVSYLRRQGHTDFDINGKVYK